MNTFGNRIKVTVFGQSHAEQMGVVIDGLPSGFEIDTDKVQSFLSRRAPGKNAYSTSRREADRAEFVTGLYCGKTCGAPLTAIIKNSDMHSGDYSELSAKPRPSHADYPAHVKYGDSYDVRGGGQFSGRLTAPVCIAGSIIMQLLEEKGIYIGAHVSSVGEIYDDGFDKCFADKNMLQSCAEKEFPALNQEKAELMKKRILEAKNKLDSVGGTIECGIAGLPAGLGEPCFEGVENLIAQCVFAVPAVKGIEFGLGFGSSAISGSQNNDGYTVDENGKITTLTNNAGGICGGITTGMPVIFRAAFKPTPSIARPQRTIDLTTGENTSLEIKGRHDPCIVQRAVPCVEAAAAIAISQYIL